MTAWIGQHDVAFTSFISISIDSHLTMNSSTVQYCNYEQFSTAIMNSSVLQL